MNEDIRMKRTNDLIQQSRQNGGSFLKVEVHLRQSPDYRVNKGPLEFIASDDYFDEGAYHVHTDEGETISVPKENILYIWKYPIDKDEED